MKRTSSVICCYWGSYVPISMVFNGRFVRISGGWYESTVVAAGEEKLKKES